jgi:hypothetical protein
MAGVPVHSLFQAYYILSKRIVLFGKDYRENKENMAVFNSIHVIMQEGMPGEIDVPWGDSHGRSSRAACNDRPE